MRDKRSYYLKNINECVITVLHYFFFVLKYSENKSRKDSNCLRAPKIKIPS